MKPMRKEFFEYVWGILVKHAGANKDDRELFVFAFAEKKEHTMEYRSRPSRFWW
jgi:hypothetical protein